MQPGKLTTYDHRHWILDKYMQCRRKNPNWSLRAFAKWLDISPAALSEIISGKRPLSQKAATRMAGKMGLAPDQRRLFLRAAWLAKLESKLPEDEEINQLQDGAFNPIDVETFKLVSDWYHLAILSLLETDGVDTRSEAISRRLQISLKEASQALRRLERLGMIKRVRGRYCPPAKLPSIYTKGYDAAMRNLLHQLLNKAGDSLENDAAEDRELSVTVMAIDPTKLSQARSAIKRFRREMSKFLETGKRNRVYSLAVQLVPLDRAEEELKSC